MYLTPDHADPKTSGIRTGIGDETETQRVGSLLVPNSTSFSLEDTLPTGRISAILCTDLFDI